MSTLELKVPPPAVALFVGLSMWGISTQTQTVDIGFVARLVAATALACAGGVFSFLGVVAFRKARTTVNPMKPESSSSLVTDGVYRFTRNPMYVGFLFVLIAWAIFLASPWSLFGPIAFVLYLSRFQIVPEERALLSMFGDTYRDYQSRVRRWL